VVGIIEEVEKMILSTMVSAQNGYQKAQKLEEVVGEAGTVIEELVEVSEQSQLQAHSIGQVTQEVKQLTEAIKVATSQQRIESRQVLEALTKLSKVAHQNAAIGNNSDFSLSENLIEEEPNFNNIVVS
jgi:hypothetical protein